MCAMYNMRFSTYFLTLDYLIKKLWVIICYAVKHSLITSAKLSLVSSCEQYYTSLSSVLNFCQNLSW